MSEAAFPRWLHSAVHECAPDHSVDTITVGKLREAARTIDELYEALEHCLREWGGFTIRGETERKALAALAKARGES